MWRDIEDRHSDIMKLESSLKELRDMFQDLALLVEQQVYAPGTIDYACFVIVMATTMSVVVLPSMQWTATARVHPVHLLRASWTPRGLPIFWIKRVSLSLKSLCRQLQYYAHNCHLLLLSPKADTHFTIPRRVEGWVDLAGWHCTKMPVVSHPSEYWPGRSYSGFVDMTQPMAAERIWVCSL